MINGKRLIKIKQILNKNKGEEHLLNTWLSFINSNLTQQDRISNTKQLVSIFRRLNGKYTKRKEYLRIDGYFVVNTYYGWLK